MITTDQQILNCHYTDAGNAQALALLYGNKLRYVHGIGWHIWVGSHWQPDTEDQALEYFRQLARKRQQLISMYANPDDKQDLWSLALRLENTGKASQCLKMAKAFAGLWL